MSIFDHNPLWKPEQHSPGERLTAARTFEQLLDALASIAALQDETARERTEKLSVTIQELQRHPGIFPARAQELQSTLPPPIYRSLVHCLDTLLMTKGGRPKFVHGENVRLIENGQLVPATVIISGSKVPQGNKEDVEILVQSSNEKPDFRTVKRTQVINSGQLAL